jgi:hypothetical protein
VKIYATTDYSIFKDIKGNRPVNHSKVKNITDSIREINLLEQNPIIVNDKMEVIDGQHRLYAASELQTPIFYTIKEGANLRTVQLINKNLSSWTKYNFLSSFIANDYQEYAVLKDFFVRHDIGLSIAIALITGSLKRPDMDQSMQDFISGEFKVTHLKQGEEFITQAEKLSQYLEGDYWKSLNFLRALEIVYQEVNPDLFRERVANSNIRLRRRPSVREYLRDFEEVYNYRQRKQITRFLKTNQNPRENGKFVKKEVKEMKLGN